MAFNPSGVSGEYHWLVEIYLNATTWRFADEDLSIVSGSHTGFFYEGRLQESAVVSKRLGSFVEPKEVIDSFAIPIDNSDGLLGERIDGATLANRSACVLVGEGRYKQDYSPVFEGNVVFPNGWDYTEGGDATIVLSDRRLKDRTFLPPSDKVYSRERYPLIELKSIGSFEGIIIGNWASNAASGASIPCVCIDTTIPKFRMAGHAVGAPDRYLKNAQVLSPGTDIQNLDAAAGTFELASGVGYNATADTISINCQGIQTINGTTIEQPAEVLKMLQTTYQGVTATDLNVTAYGTLNGKTKGEVVRRYITSPNIENRPSTELLFGQLQNEAAFDIRFVGGKYEPRFRDLDFDESLPVYDETDILIAGVGREVPSVRTLPDPDRFFANKMTTKYEYSPVDALFLNNYATANQESITQVQATIEREMTFEWYWDSVSIEARVSRELFLFSTEPQAVEIEVANRGLLRNVGDQFKLTIGHYNERTFQVRHIDKDFGQMTARMRGYSIFSTDFGHWTDGSAPNFSSASEAQKDSQGFWCNAAGLADAGDPNSNISKWG